MPQPLGVTIAFHVALAFALAFNLAFAVTVAFAVTDGMRQPYSNPHTFAHQDAGPPQDRRE